MKRIKSDFSACDFVECGPRLAAKPVIDIDVVVEEQDVAAARDHLAVRDMLRSNRTLRDEYGALKLKLAASAADTGQHLEGKTSFLLHILELSGIEPQELSEIEEINKARQ